MDDVKLQCLSNPIVFDNGTVGFSVEAEGGDSANVFCSLTDVGDMMSFLGMLARDAGEARNLPQPDTGKTYNELAPIPAQGIGFQAGQTPETTLIVVRLSGFDMAFEVPSSELARLGPELSRIGLTLSASGPKPQ